MNFMVYETKFNIITLSTKRLKNEKYLLEYVTLTDYKFFLLKKRRKRGGGVGVYVRNCIKYKVRNYISTDERLEHLWIEVQGKSKELP